MAPRLALAAAPPGAEPSPEETARPHTVERFAGTAQALGQRTTVTYDDAGRARQRVTVDPDDGDRPLSRETREYDDAGRLTRVTRWRHDDTASAPTIEVEERRYDAQGHLVQVREQGRRGERTGTVEWTWRDGHAVEARRLDAHGKELERDTYTWTCADAGRPAWVASWTHKTTATRWTVTYQRDAKGRLDREIHSRDGVTSYRYDEAGRLVERTARGPVQGGRAPGAPTKSGPVVEKVRYRWDSAGRLAERVVERNAWPRPTKVRFLYRYAP